MTSSHPTPGTAEAQASDEQVRRLLGLADGWLANGTAKKHYNEVENCEHDERLHDGWLELGQEAMRAQALFDWFGIADGMPQGKGDLDWRAGVALLRLSRAESVLGNIAAAHARETGPAGMVGDYCVECEHNWPCPTYLWASGDRDPLLQPWLPEDDETEAVS